MRVRRAQSCRVFQQQRCHSADPRWLFRKFSLRLPQPPIQKINTAFRRGVDPEGGDVFEAVDEVQLGGNAGGVECCVHGAGVFDAHGEIESAVVEKGRRIIRGQHC